MDFNMDSLISISLFIAGILILVVIQGPVSGYTGREFVIKLNNSQFAPLKGTSNYQIKENVNYSASVPTLIGQKVNAVMKVHSSNGSVLKTTSFPAGFTANKTGVIQLLTNIPVSMSQNISAVTVFTNLNKTTVLSNPVTASAPESNLIKSSEFTPTVITNKT